MTMSLTVSDDDLYKKYESSWPIPPGTTLLGPYEIPSQGDHDSPLFISAVTAADLPEIIRVLNIDQEIYYNTGSFQYPYLESHAVTRMDNVHKWRIEFGFNNRWAMRTSPDGPLVGWIHCFPVSDCPLIIHPLDPDRHVKILELGYWVSPEHRGKGFGSRSARFVVDEIGFKVLKSDIARARAYVENIGSRKVLEAAGMRCELASKREFVIKLQKEMDLCYYAVHRDPSTHHILHDGTV